MGGSGPFGGGGKGGMQPPPPLTELDKEKIRLSGMPGPSQQGEALSGLSGGWLFSPEQQEVMSAIPWWKEFLAGNRDLAGSAPADQFRVGGAGQIASQQAQQMGGGGGGGGFPGPPPVALMKALK